MKSISFILPGTNLHNAQILTSPVGLFPSLSYIFWFVDFLSCIPYIQLMYRCIVQTIKTNVIGTLNMLGLAKRVGAR